jgi:hypothetical protein
MKTITANIPARKLGKTTIAARTDTYIQDDEGRWSSPDFGPLTEADVIDMAKRATNWKEIKAAHFPMVGFHS